MSDKDQLQKLMAGSGLSLVGDPIDDPDTEDVQILFVKTSGHEEHLVDTLVQRLTRKLQLVGRNVKIVATSSSGAQVETLMEASIKTRFPEIALEVTVAAGPGTAAVWVNLPAATPVEKSAEVSMLVYQFLKQLGIENPIVKFQADRNYPSTTACLRVLRRSAPCAAEKLVQLLQLPGFDPMSLPEVRRFLDTARRKGQVVRRNDGCYILSMQCLMDLGSSRDRFSPDISRALALRRLGA